MYEDVYNYTYNSIRLLVYNYKIVQHINMKFRLGFRILILKLCSKQRGVIMLLVILNLLYPPQCNASDAPLHNTIGCALHV